MRANDSSRSMLSTTYLPHDHLTALDGGNLTCGGVERPIDFDEVVCRLLQPVQQLLVGSRRCAFETG